MRKLLRAAIDKAGGVRPFGAEHGIDPTYVGRVRDGAKLATAILDALGLEECPPTYRRKSKR